MLNVYIAAKQKGMVKEDHKPLPNTIYIGIDCGVNTGLATIMNGVYTDVRTCGIYKAMKYVVDMHEHAERLDKKLVVYIENPNLRSWFGGSGREKLQGAGSIKRDYSVWREVFEHHNITHIDVSPKDVGSQFDNVATFKTATSWTKRASKHARDACKMIYQHKTK